MMTNSPPFQKNLLPPLIKITDVAKILSVSRCTVHHLVDSGDLEASKINAAGKIRRHRRVTRESLLRFYKKRFGHSLDRALANPFQP